MGLVRRLCHRHSSHSTLMVREKRLPDVMPQQQASEVQAVEARRPTVLYDQNSSHIVSVYTAAFSSTFLRPEYRPTAVPPFKTHSTYCTVSDVNDPGSSDRRGTVSATSPSMGAGSRRRPGDHQHRHQSHSIFIEDPDSSVINRHRWRHRQCHGREGVAD